MTSHENIPQIQFPFLEIETSEKQTREIVDAGNKLNSKNAKSDISNRGFHFHFEEEIE